MSNKKIIVLGYSAGVHAASTFAAQQPNHQVLVANTEDVNNDIRTDSSKELSQHLIEQTSFALTRLSNRLDDDYSMKIKKYRSCSNAKRMTKRTRKSKTYGRRK